MAFYSYNGQLGGLVSGLNFGDCIQILAPGNASQCVCSARNRVRDPYLLRQPDQVVIAVAPDETNLDLLLTGLRWLICLRVYGLYG
jgi:hypothetical protein